MLHASRLSSLTYFLISLAMLAAFALILQQMGHIWICKCGYVKLWHGVTFSSENSQHLTDWYTFSHVIHGFVFYWFLRIIGKRFNWPLGLSFILAVFVEISWEVFENSDFIINRYRAVTVSLDYFGDSIINSIMDVLFMMVGFFLAWRIPVWSSIAIVIFLELFVGYWIRDNLTLNIIMLLYPFDAILKWQQGSV